RVHRSACAYPSTLRCIIHGVPIVHGQVPSTNLDPEDDDYDDDGGSPRGYDADDDSREIGPRCSPLHLHNALSAYCHAKIHAHCAVAPCITRRQTILVQQIDRCQIRGATRATRDRCPGVLEDEERSETGEEDEDEGVKEEEPEEKEQPLDKLHGEGAHHRVTVVKEG
ncbi:hypothetical protein ALC62_07898, partial [Cyphomyrmex costatus]